MSRARDYRRNKDGRAVDRFAGRRKRYKPLLAALGLEAQFARMTRRSQEAFWAVKYPDAATEFDDGVPPAARADVQKSIRETMTDVETVDGAKAKIPARDFTAILLALKRCVDATDPSRMPPATADFVRAARPRLADAHDKYFSSGAIDQARYAQWAAVKHSRADSRVVAMRGEYRDVDTPKPHVAFVTVSAAPDRARPTLDGEPRPAWRVGHSRFPEGVRWISWNAREMGIGPEDELPVYVQGHALRHLHERMDAVDGPGWSEWYLADAMGEPVIAGRLKNGDWLVEYRLNDKRCGYLVVARAGPLVVVRTFLFLTMTGTPEGDRLHDRFRLTRGEAAWLNLHRMSSFTKTDLRDDPDLRAILDGCGCGHLIDLRGDSDLSPLIGGYAAQVRKFVGMTPSPDPGLSLEGEAPAPADDAPESGEVQ